MAHVEVDNFVRKFKLLLSAGYEASLDLSSSLGEVTINLKCKVGRLSPPLSPNFGENLINGTHVKREFPSRQRRRARRAAARDTLQDNVSVELCDANSAEECIHVVSDDESKCGTRTTVEDGNSPVKEVDAGTDTTDIAAAVATNVGVTADVDMTNGVVVIPLEKFAISDAQIEKAITEKLAAKMVKVRRIEIHRNNVDGSFLRGDVLIEPTAVERVNETDFEFATCVVHSCPIQQHENG